MVQTQANSQQITPFLWFDHQAEEAARFYTSIFPNSKITSIHPKARVQGQPVQPTIVSFELNGLALMGLNGGPHFSFSPAISLFVSCDTQQEVDELWDKLLEGGGQPERCGWLKDRYGLSWQIVPRLLGELMQSEEPERAARVNEAMLKMIKLDVQTLKEAYEA